MTQAEFDKLCRLVQQWNENRLDLFHLSYPTRDLEIQGVMRFYFQDVGGKVSTKCIRVSSTATTQAVIEALVEKFLPDLKMLTDPEYSIWEVHEGGEERQLDAHEKPLLVQLTWHKDDREGRFLLRKHGTQYLPLSALEQHDNRSNIKRNGKRFSKREKKEVKQKHKEIVSVNGGREELNVTDLYRQVPPTTFTRTISNPEIVMKKRREKKLEARLKELGHGGSVKIYGGEVVPSRPYVTLLVSLKDRADALLRESLVKYNMEDADPSQFQLVQVTVPYSENSRHSLTDLRNVGETRERVLHPDDCPLLELANRPQNAPDVFFALRRKQRGIPPSSDYSHRTSSPVEQPDARSSDGVSSGVYLVNSADGTSYPIVDGVTEVGSDVSLKELAAHNICLPNTRPRHCVFTFMDGVVTITPSAGDATIHVNERAISQTVILSDGSRLLLGTDNHLVLYHSGGKAASRAPSEPRLSSGWRNGALSAPEWRSNGAASRGFVPPVTLSIGDNRVWDFLLEAMSRSAESAPFALSAAYSLFLAAHCFAEQAKPFLGQFIGRVSVHLSHIAMENAGRDRLLSWLSNASELWHLLSFDPLLSPTQLLPIKQSIERLFTALVQLSRHALENLSPLVLDEHLSDEEATREVVGMLDGTLRAARSFRLNAQLTIQLSSQLFSTFNRVIFNTLVSRPVVSRALGFRLAARLSIIHEWAEMMGVELASECLLDRSRQAANLLAADRDDLAAMGATAYKLNSLQIRHLLTHLDKDEPPLGADVVQRMVGLAERQADETANEEKVELSVEETENLTLPFSIPVDGYTSDESSSVHTGLLQFLHALRDKGLCTSVDTHPESPGWICPEGMSAFPAQGINAFPAHQPNKSFDHPPASQGDIVLISLYRGNTGIGLSIVAAQGVGDKNIGIYVKKVIEGSIAAKDGRLSAGDELLAVNGQALTGLTQEQAAQCMANSGSEVCLEVRKGAASKNGLAAFLTPDRPFTPNQTPQSPVGRSTYSNGMDAPSGMSTSLSLEASNYAAINKETLQRGPSSAFSAPHHVKSVSSSDLYRSQHNPHQSHDPNASFSARSTTGGFNALPPYYRRPTVIQPGRSCPSPSQLRQGAVSPSALRYGAVSPSILRHGAVSPSWLGRGPDDSRASAHSDILPARIYPAPRREPHMREIPIERSMERPSTTFDVVGAVPTPFQTASDIGRGIVPRRPISTINNEEDRRVRQLEHESRLVNISDDDWRTNSRHITDTDSHRYRQLIARPQSATAPAVRRETVIDDVIDHRVPHSSHATTLNGENAPWHNRIQKEYEEELLDSPGILGANEVYRDPRQRKLNEIQANVDWNNKMDGSRLAFGEKMKMFATRIGETPPRPRATESSAQRIIQDEP